MAQNTLPTSGSPLRSSSQNADVVNLDDVIEEQIGGGRRLPSPPPQLTPTRFRTHVKATMHDSGLVRSAQARRERLLDLSQSNGAPDDDEDPFRVKFTPPPVPRANTNVQCASLLFGGSQGSCNSSPFPMHEINPDVSGTALKVQAPRQCTTPPQLIVESSSSCSEKEKGEKKVVEAPRSKSMTTVSSEHEKTAVDEAGSLSVHCATVPRPLQPVVPVSQTNGSHESDEDTPRQKVASDGNLTVWPDGTISFGEPANTDFDLDVNFGRSETPSPSNHGESIQSRPLLVTEHNAKGWFTATDEPPFVVGRTAASVAAMLEEGFERINDEFNTLSGRVRMPIQQVVQRFTQQYARSNSMNEWNAYQQYFTAHKARELQRLPDECIAAEKMSKCYKLFCEQFPDTYKQILSVYKDTVALGNAEKTVAQRQQLFHSTSKRFTQLFNSVAKCHAFEGAFLLAGSVVNQDGGIGYMHTTPGAENFFLERCRADEDEMVGHFKAHIYSRSSLAMVAEAFDGGREPQDPCEMNDQSNKRSHRPSTTDADDAGPSEMKDEDRRQFQGSSLATDSVNTCTVEQSSLDSEERGDHGRLRTFGTWMQLGIWETFSLEEPTEELGEELNRGSKGISDLTLAECATLIAALTDKSKHGLHFVVKPDLHDALIYSRSPVIYGAPPDTDSKHAFAKRMYANLKCDRHGAARKSIAATTRLKKRTTGKSTREVEVISIPDSDEIIPIPTPQTKAKSRPTSARDSNEVEEIPSIVRKSSRLQPRVVIVQSSKSKKPTRRVVDSEDDDNDSIDAVDSEYNPDDKASNNDGSDTEGVSIEDEDSVLEDERQSSSCKRKRTLDDTGRAPKRLAKNPKPVLPRHISPVSTLSKGKGKSLDVAAGRAVGYADETSADEAHTSHASRSVFGDAGHASKTLAISPMPVDPPPVYPDTSSSKDKSGRDASEANQSRSHTISATLPTSPDDGCVEVPRKIRTSADDNHDTNPQVMDVQCKSPVLGAQHCASECIPSSPRMPPAYHALQEPSKDSPSITHTSENSQVAPPPSHLYSPFPSRPRPSLPLDEASSLAVTNKRPKPRRLTRDDRASAHDSKNAFNLRHRMRRPAGNPDLMTLSVPSAGLIAAEEGRAYKDGDQVEIGDVGRIETEDRGTGESRQNMAGQRPTGLPPRYVYDYHPTWHPGIHYERDPYAAQYHAARGFADHFPAFVHDPWENGHAQYEDQIEYVRDGVWYGPPDRNRRVQVSQIPYPPPRTHPNDAIPSYYYPGTRSRPHTQFRPSPVLRVSPQADRPSGAVPGPSQHHSYTPPAQSTTSVQNRNTSPEPEANTNA
ncbi:hypothetical protein EDD15DRAFT_2358040 [Pisolithus albus]|nr:hypothetical protein EDD15DRAFT_2358040 [Pisolithus albus]